MQGLVDGPPGLRQSRHSRGSPLVAQVQPVTCLRLRNVAWPGAGGEMLLREINPKYLMGLSWQRMVVPYHHRFAAL